MNELFEYTKERLLKNDEFKRIRGSLENEIREIMQEIILPSLSDTEFFINNVFTGGTALRMLYGLKRYSDDLDFTMKKNEIDSFNWEKYTSKIIEDGKKLGLIFNCEYSTDSYGNKIVKIRSDTLLEMISGKNIVPRAFTRKNQRGMVTVKLETNYSTGNFNDEIKIVDSFKKSEVRVFDIHSLFAGKINAVLTREITNNKTKLKERTDKGRDWYDLIWYIDRKIKPNYDFLSSKLDYKGDFGGKHIKADNDWVKEALMKRMEGLNYDQLNNDIVLITLKENRIILNKNILIEKINLFG